MKTYKFEVYAEAKVRSRMASDFVTEAESEKEAREKAISFYKEYSNLKNHAFKLISGSEDADKEG